MKTPAELICMPHRERRAAWNELDVILWAVAWILKPMRDSSAGDRAGAA